MESLALGHNFGAYEDAQQQGQTDYTRQQQEYYQENLNLINQGKIDFAFTMKLTGKFILFMSLSGGAVFISRILPIFSFGGFAVRLLTFAIVGKEAIFNPSDKERRDFQILFLSIGLGNVGAEWDVWLSISQAVSDFFALYGTAIFGGSGLLLVAILWLLFRGNDSHQQSNQVNSLNAYNNYNTVDYNNDD